MNHAERILPLLDELLKKSKTSFKDIDAFLIGKGPGSFTGLRVGFATLKGFLAGAEVPCYGALSMDLIAENKNFSRMPEGSHLAVALDAFRERIYLRVYRRGHGSWIPENEPKVLSAEETAAALPGEVTVTGNALAKYASIFKKSSAKKIIFTDEKNWFPNASSLISLFEKGDSKVEKIPRRKLLPFYFRLSEAEERKNAHASC